MKRLQAYYSKGHKIKYLFAASAVFCLATLILGLMLGSTVISPISFSDAIHARILLYVRLPRVLASLVSGAALAVSGAVIQGVLANRLASPSIIGVNAGAGLAVTLGTALGLLGGWQMACISFMGAFAAVMLIVLGAQKWGASRGTVILMGVSLNSLLNAFSSTIVTFHPEIGVMSNDFKVGDLSAVTYGRLIPAAVLSVLSLILLVALSNELEILGLGDENARGLGMNTQRVRAGLLLLASVLAGCAVMLGGLISFVGLIVPHVVRRLGGIRTKHLLPLSALVGGGFVTLCDTLARTLFSPYEIPVGILLAFIGAPFFLFLLLRAKGGRTDDQA